MGPGHRRYTEGGDRSRCVTDQIWMGPTRSSPPDASAACLVTHTLYADGQSQDSQMLDARLKSFWELESFGIVEEAECSIQDDFVPTSDYLVDLLISSQILIPTELSGPVVEEYINPALIGL